MKTSPDPAQQGAERVERWALIALFGYTLIALAGYSTFGLNPQNFENLPAQDFAIFVYQIAFVFFSRAQIIVSGLALFAVLAVRSGTRWLPAFAAIYLISFTAEHVGTGYGFPFSGYEYTMLLGARLGPRVPLVIPMSWFLMAAPSWVLAREVFPEARAWAGRILVASLLLVTWDLALDPAMSYMTTYWIWEKTGSFYGMPWVNLLGWFGTGVLIFTALEVLQARINWAAGLRPRWAAAYYAGVLLMPLGMVTAGGLWGSTAATLAALALLWALYVMRRRGASAQGPVTGTASPGPSGAMHAGSGTAS